MLEAKAAVVHWDDRGYGGMAWYLVGALRIDLRSRVVGMMPVKDVVNALIHSMARSQ